MNGTSTSASRQRSSREATSGPARLCIVRMKTRSM